MNPFEKRATEFVRDPMAFLPYVTPEPLLTFLEPYAKLDVLFDRLAMVIGSPGSGKTTLARLFLFPTVYTLFRSKTLDEYAPLRDALVKCGALTPNEDPAVAGCRIPMETDYRECWELPYDEELRNNLMFSLLQSRTMLHWLRGFEEVGISVRDVRLIPRSDSAAALEAIGGTDLESVRDVARRVEAETYRVTGSLVAPPVSELPGAATSAYRPFDVVEAFELKIGEKAVILRPLLICDDAHWLHPQQLEAAIRWLARREIRISRWLLTRIDALRPHEVLRPSAAMSSDAAGFDPRREMTKIWMQQAADADRRTSRRAFRKIAHDMSERYLQQMPVFARRRLVDLEHLLDADPPRVSQGKVEALAASTTSDRLKITSDRRKEFAQEVDEVISKMEKKPGPEVSLAMIRILAERYHKRIPQNSLFDTDPEPAKPIKASVDVRVGAELQLLHEIDRPFFYGFDVLCDAANENAERFLNLAAILVRQLETQLIRDDPDKRLPALLQDRLLRERATAILNEKDFPERNRVLRLANRIAAECIAKTLEANASLADGANAWGVLQSEFDTIAEKHSELARILQYGSAYNVFTLVRDYGTKGQDWCLIELSGTLSLRWGLTMKRGGFLERRLSDLHDAVGTEGAT